MLTVEEILREIADELEEILREAQDALADTPCEMPAVWYTLTLSPRPWETLFTVHYNEAPVPGAPVRF